MKLSEAIRNGVKGTFQTKASLIKRDNQNKIVGCCALGAVGIGAFGINDPQLKNDNETYLRLWDWFPELTNLCECPHTHHKRELYRVIYHLNDGEGWSREKIANWLESKGL